VPKRGHTYVCVCVCIYIYIYIEGSLSAPATGVPQPNSGGNFRLMGSISVLLVDWTPTRGQEGMCIQYTRICSLINVFSLVDWTPTRGQEGMCMLSLSHLPPPLSLLTPSLQGMTTNYALRRGGL